MIFREGFFMIISRKLKNKVVVEWQFCDTSIICPYCQIGKLSVNYKYNYRRTETETEWNTQCSHCFSKSSIFIKRNIHL